MRRPPHSLGRRTLKAQRRTIVKAAIVISARADSREFRPFCISLKGWSLRVLTERMLAGPEDGSRPLLKRFSNGPRQGSPLAHSGQVAQIAGSRFEESFNADAVGRFQPRLGPNCLGNTLRQSLAGAKRQVEPAREEALEDPKV